ncbi:unnamed protein product [Haemonchus placei]|uniref:Uncharacterized protein n=1 Tax=Haemonchus placei TaxID=6290 RepID=A0A0N4WKE9_HAEPC|nr:unnamed protein product [Haemonchus placei]
MEHSIRYTGVLEGVTLERFRRLSKVFRSSSFSRRRTSRTMPRTTLDTASCSDSSATSSAIFTILEGVVELLDGVVSSGVPLLTEMSSPAVNDVVCNKSERLRSIRDVSS